MPIQPLNADSSPQELIETVNRHAAALRSLDESERASADARVKMERMAIETKSVLERAQAASSAAWEAEGDDALLLRQFTDGDRVQLGNQRESLYSPDGPIHLQREGLLTAQLGTTPQHERLITAYRSLALAHALARRVPAAAGVRRAAYQSFARAAVEMPGKIGAFFRSAFSTQEGWQRAINGSAGAGGELLQVPTISAVRRPTDLARRIAGLVPGASAPAATFKPPIITGRAISRRRGAVQNDPSRFPINNFTSAEASVSVVNRTVMALVDTLWLVDQSAVVDPSELIWSWLMSGDADSLEMAILHGDTAGTHQDTLSTWTMGGLYTAGDLDGSDSPLRFWLGLRANAHDDSATVSAGGTFDAADHFGALDLMGVHGDGAVMMVGLHALYTQLLANSLFTTVEKFGAAATLLTGEIGRVGKTPVVISQMLPDQFDSTSGLYTGSNSSSIAVYANLSRYSLYNYANGEEDFETKEAQNGAVYLGMVRRDILTRNTVSGEKPAALLYNL